MRKRSNRQGWIYVAQRLDGLIKVGFSTDPRQRIRLLESAYGDLYVLCCVPGTERDERMLLRRWAEHLAEGAEWFHPDDDIWERALLQGQTLLERRGGLCRFERRTAA